MLSESVINIKGVGEKLASDFQSMDIHTIEDLLFYFPSRYDVFEIKPLSELIHEDKVTMEGTVINNPNLSYFGCNLYRVFCDVEVDHVAVKAVMFYGASAKTHIKMGDKITLPGQWDAHGLLITVNHHKKGT